MVGLEVGLASSPPSLCDIGWKEVRLGGGTCQRPQGTSGVDPTLHWALRMLLKLRNLKTYYCLLFKQLSSRILFLFILSDFKKSTVPSCLRNKRLGRDSALHTRTGMRAYTPASRSPAGLEVPWCPQASKVLWGQRVYRPLLHAWSHQARLPTM